MEETPLAKFVHALVFLGICAAIVFVGWREPLAYRFMTPQEIAEDQKPPMQPEVINRVESWRPTRTSLDRTAY